MNVYQKTRLFLLSLMMGIPTISTSTIAGINYFLHHDSTKVIETEVGKVTIKSKMDGIAAYTTTKFLNGKPFFVERYNPEKGSYRFIDKDLDGLVDEIYEEPGFCSWKKGVSYVREFDFEQNPEIFWKADREFKVQVKLFGYDYSDTIR
ncbi:MAG: hypothetical protein KKA62_03260 [Nanoarchaeota archaeon]|nr:hypothetical protein [Nanoarchaeota archaeon]MBU1644343.1 hypothetical protein [Nanoarchaeota archaeon]MBU1976944.1 hypothetical protein [Nanoarchaeota archaeon]